MKDRIGAALAAQGQDNKTIENIANENSVAAGSANEAYAVNQIAGAEKAASGASSGPVGANGVISDESTGMAGAKTMAGAAIDAAQMGSGENATDTDAESEEDAAERIKQDLLTVQGFRFTALADAKTAEEEYKKMVYISQRMNKDNPEEILAIYDKMIENGLFVTPVGVDFLMRTREFLVDCGAIESERIRPIETGSLFTQRARNEARAAARPRMTVDLVEENKNIKRKYHIAIAVAIISVCMVIAMFIIARTSDNPNIINYKHAIENQYSEWEESLAIKEQELKEKENALNEGSGGNGGDVMIIDVD